MPRPPLVIHIVGLKNTGKSRLAEALIRELVGRGLKTGALKHDGCGHFQWDREGTDTYRMTGAGSMLTGIVSEKSFALHAPAGLDLDLERVVEVFFAGFDIVVIEGFKGHRARKVEVLREGFSTGLLSTGEELVATFGDRLFDLEVPHFEDQEAGRLAEFLERMCSGDGGEGPRAGRQ